MVEFDRSYAGRGSCQVTLVADHEQDLAQHRGGMCFLPNEMTDSIKIALVAFCCAFLLISCAANCPRPPLPLPADVRPKKTVSFGNTYSLHKNRSSLRLVSGQELRCSFTSEGAFDLSSRYSLTDRFDLGGRVGCADIGFDLRYQILKNAKYPSVSVGVGSGIASRFGGVYLSKKYSVKNFIMEPLANLNYTDKRNHYWIPLPEEFRTGNDVEVRGVYSEILEDGKFIDFVLGLGVGKKDDKKEISIYLGIVPQYYFSKQISSHGCINCDVKASAYHHSDDILYVLTLSVSKF